MSVYLCGLVRFGRKLTIPYDEIIKYKGYREGMVLVARIKNGDIIGKVSVGIKDTHLFGAMEKVAYIFDMRISLQHQRMGVGRLLYEAI